jgi:hypothetical protein
MRINKQQLIKSEVKWKRLLERRQSDELVVVVNTAVFFIGVENLLKFYIYSLTISLRYEMIISSAINLI